MKKILLVLLLCVFFINVVSAFGWNDGNLVSYYKLDETSGAVIDFTGNYNANSYGATRGIAGKIGNAYLFDGVNDRINQTTFPNMTAGTMTVCTWFNYANNNVGTIVLGRWEGGLESWAFAFTAGGKLQFIIYDGTGQKSVVSVNNYNDTAWHYACGRTNTTHVRLSIDNVQVIAPVAYDGTVKNTPKDLSIGGETWGSGWYNGSIDEIGIWNVSLTDANLTELWNSGTGISPSIVSTMKPVVNISAPSSLANYGKYGANLTLNITAYDDNDFSCKYNYNYTNTTFACPNATLTSINFTLTTQKNITVFVTDASGNITSEFTSWHYKIFENSRSYDASTMGGTAAQFSINATINNSYALSIPYLKYNQTLYSGTFTQDGSTIIATISKEIPFVSTQQNITFYWSFKLSNGEFINTTSNNQTINTLALDDCSVYSNIIFNFTLHDEITLSKLQNVTTEYLFSIYNPTRSISLLNLSSTKYTNPLTICASSALTTSTQYSLDGTLKFTGNDTVNGNLTYIGARYYHLLNFNLTNSTVPRVNPLYLITQENSTAFQLTFRDSTLTLTDNILVYVQKQYVALNEYKTVEIPLTDSNGQAILNLVKNTGTYNLIMVDINGNIVATFNRVTAFCNDLIGTCTLDLNAPSSTEVTYNYSSVAGISYSAPTYYSTTNLISITFSSITSSIPTVRLEVISENQFINTTICNNSLEALVGTITCDVSPAIGSNDYLYSYVYSNNQLIGMYTTSLLEGSTGGLLGIDGFFLAFIFMLIIILLFSEDRQTLLIALGIGWISIIMFNLLRGSMMGRGAAGMWLIITIIIFLYKLKKEESG